MILKWRGSPQWIDTPCKSSLTKPYPQLLYILTMHYSYAVPREAVEYYGKDFVNHPVGTGPLSTGGMAKKFSNRV